MQVSLLRDFASLAYDACWLTGLPPKHFFLVGKPKIDGGFRHALGTCKDVKIMIKSARAGRT